MIELLRRTAKRTEKITRKETLQKFNTQLDRVMDLKVEEQLLRGDKARMIQLESAIKEANGNVKWVEGLIAADLKKRATLQQWVAVGVLFGMGLISPVNADQVASKGSDIINNNGQLTQRIVDRVQHIILPTSTGFKPPERAR